jgi:hypothetical protein
MNPHPRIRKTIKWGGAAVTLLLLAAWLASGGWTTDWLSPSGRDIGIGRGQIWSIQYVPPSPARPGTPSGTGRFARVVDGMTGRSTFDLALGGGRGWESLILPLWPFVAAALLITIAAWRADALARRRERTHLCPNCGYDRTGLVANVVCPECGKLPA